MGIFLFLLRNEHLDKEVPPPITELFLVLENCLKKISEPKLTPHGETMISLGFQSPLRKFYQLCKSL